MHLVMGISMGGMHAWMWSILYPDFMDGILPIVCLPHSIDGRNLLWRRMLIRGVADGALMRMMLRGVPELERELRSIADCDKFIDQGQRMIHNDDDLKYALDASRDYRPEEQLLRITTQVLALNFSDDQLNPEQLHVLQSCMRHVRHGCYVIQDNDTHGHATASYPQLWARHVRTFLTVLSLRKRSPCRESKSVSSLAANGPFAPRM